VFLATPHRGSNAANLASICGSIVNSFASAGLGPKTVRTDLLKTLIYDSDTLQDLTMSARNRLGNVHVVSFYETLPLPMGPLSPSLVSLCSTTRNNRLSMLWQRKLTSGTGCQPCFCYAWHSIRRSNSHARRSQNYLSFSWRDRKLLESGESSSKDCH
jgi:hypothetical protein